MPRRRPQQPATPPGLPPIPSGAYKKQYYPYPDTVYYLQTPDDDEWSRGDISNMTQSTILHIVIDEETGQSYQVYAEYIRKRASWD